jgi:hypothetical protein
MGARAGPRFLQGNGALSLDKPNPRAIMLCARPASSIWQSRGLLIPWLQVRVLRGSLRSGSAPGLCRNPFSREERVSCWSLLAGHYLAHWKLRRFAGRADSPVSVAARSPVAGSLSPATARPLQRGRSRGARRAAACPSLAAGGGLGCCLLVCNGKAAGCMGAILPLGLTSPVRRMYTSPGDNGGGRARG